MNYKESKKLLDAIKKSKKILVNCHRTPDPDSVGSALSMHAVLKKLGKESELVCPTELNEHLRFLKNSEKVKTINFGKFDFSSYDLFISLDSGGWDMVSNNKSLVPPDIPIVVIDHHRTNKRYGNINLVDSKVNSTAEVLYKVYEDWEVKIDKNIATALLTGVIGDTGSFRYPRTTPETFIIASKLLDSGAQKDEINKHLYFTLDLNVMRFWAELIKKMKVEEEKKFVWTALPFKVFEKYGKPSDAKERVATDLIQSVRGTNFGIVMVETEENNLSVSLRSRTGFDVSEVALALDGGGHIEAAGARVEGLSFDKAVKKVLTVAKDYAKKNK